MGRCPEPLKSWPLTFLSDTLKRLCSPSISPSAIVPQTLSHRDTFVPSAAARCPWWRAQSPELDVVLFMPQGQTLRQVTSLDTSPHSHSQALHWQFHLLLGSSELIKKGVPKVSGANFERRLFLCPHWAPKGVQALTSACMLPSQLSMVRKFVGMQTGRCGRSFHCCH